MVVDTLGWFSDGRRFHISFHNSHNQTSYQCPHFLHPSFLSSTSNLHLYPMHGQYPSFYPSFSISTLPCTSPMHLPMSADSGRVLPDIQMIRILMMMILTIVLMVTSMSCRASGKICNLLRYFDGEKMLMMIAPLVQAMMMRR